MLATVLASRGLAPNLLSPTLTLNANPAIRQAAKRLVLAMAEGKRILIHGDYDADGVTASSVLYLGLRALGAQVQVFIPHRLHEGYGIHPDKVPEHIAACDVFITVDCGVTNMAEVQALLAGGVEVIVTDHHSPGTDYPKCLVVHPKQTPNYNYDYHNLTGAGVAYHVLWAVHQQLGLPDPEQYADLAAIGTIADVAPLLGENRALVTVGLQRMQDSAHAGIRAMIKLKMKSAIAPSAQDVAFLLAPLINAAGRLGEVETALELLTTQSSHRADVLAQLLETRNQERKVIQEDMYQQALSIVDPSHPALVITHQDWHAGIMGIVASKLLEKYYKPVFIVAQGKGSVRSTPGISAVEGLRHSHDLLKRFGGHSGAAGFAMAEHNMPAFQARIHEFVRKHPVPVPIVALDAPLPAAAYTASLHSELEYLEPCGEGIRSPVWWVSGALQEARQMGKTKLHYQFVLEGVRGKQWSFQGPSAGTQVDAAVELDCNDFNNKINYEYTATAMTAQMPIVFATTPESAQTDQVSAATVSRLAPLQLLDVLQQDPSRYWVYAEGEGARYLAQKHPQVRVLQPDQIATIDVTDQNIALMALPDIDILLRWYHAADELCFSWGQHTLAQYSQAPEQCRQSQPRFWQDAQYRTAAIEVYHRYQWALWYQRLSDAAWAQVIPALHTSLHTASPTSKMSADTVSVAEF